MNNEPMTHEDKIKFLAGKIATAKSVIDKVENPGFKTRVTPDVPRNVQYHKEEVAYKHLMESPISDPTVPIGMEMLSEEVKKSTHPQQTRAHGYIPNQNRDVIQAPTNTAPQPTMEIQLIEHIIKKTVEEVLKQLNEQTSINENIQIKIGSKVFGGKLTVLKENKSIK